MKIKHFNMWGLFALTYFIFSINILLAQNGKGVWVFGVDSTDAGIFFDGDKMSLIKTKVEGIDIYHSFASIMTSDTTYLYTNHHIKKTPLQGDTVRLEISHFIKNEKGEIIQNGEGIRGDPTTTNGATFVPSPDGKNFYFITITQFHPDTIFGSDEDYTRFKAKYKIRSYYSRIERQDDGSYAVVEKNIDLFGPTVAKKMAACKHANGTDWWILSHELEGTTGFLRALLTEEGIQILPTQYIGSNYCPNYDPKLVTSLGDSYIGEMVFNMSGTKLAAVSRNNIINLFDFDRCTGLLSNFQDLTYPQGTMSDEAYEKYYNVSYTVAFYKNSRFLYCSDGPDARGVFLRYKISEDTPKPYSLTRTVLPFRFKRLESLYHNAPNGDVLFGFYRNPTDNPDLDYMARIRQSDEDENVTIIDTNFFFRGSEITNTLPNNPNYDLPAEAPKYESDTFRVCRKKRKIYFKDVALDTANYRALWSPGKGLSDSTVFSPSMLCDDTTTYVLNISTKEYGCNKISRRIKILFLEENSKECSVDYVPTRTQLLPGVQIYPNPVKEILTITSNKKITRISIMDLTGRQLATREPMDIGLEYELDVRDFPHGPYLIRVETESGSVTQRVVVE